MALSQYRKKQVAIRRLLLGPDGKLNPGARVLAYELKRVCNPGSVVKFNPVTGLVDPNGTVAAAATREVWDHFVKILHLDPWEAVNLREEEE